MKASFLTSIGDLFGDLARAHRAVDAYERLNSLSDRSLAARGLRRGDLPGVAFEAAFGKQGR